MESILPLPRHASVPGGSRDCRFFALARQPQRVGGAQGQEARQIEILGTAGQELRITIIQQLAEAELTAAEYARQRSGYIRAGGGTPPPGATPLEPE